MRSGANAFHDASLPLSLVKKWSDQVKSAFGHAFPLSVTPDCEAVHTKLSSKSVNKYLPAHLRNKRANLVNWKEILLFVFTLLEALINTHSTQPFSTQCSCTWKEVWRQETKRRLLFTNTFQRMSSSAWLRTTWFSWTAHFKTICRPFLFNFYSEKFTKHGFMRSAVLICCFHFNNCMW